jgi:hypothetical protein
LGLLEFDFLPSDFFGPFFLVAGVDLADVSFSKPFTDALAADARAANLSSRILRSSSSSSCASPYKIDQK